MSDDLAAFLLARIAEDEVVAKACAEVYPPPWDVSDRGHMATVRADAPDFRVVTELDDQTTAGGQVWLGDRVAHIARWDPARVLAECEAKRGVVALHARKGIWMDDDQDYPACATCGTHYEYPVLWPCQTLRLLAFPYADRPGYDEGWRP